MAYRIRIASASVKENVRSSLCVYDENWLDCFEFVNFLALVSEFWKIGDSRDSSLLDLDNWLMDSTE